MSNGFSSADMSTAAANGHAEGYQAGYADAVEAGKDAAAPVVGRDVRSAIAGLEGSVAVGSDGEWVSVRRAARDAAVIALRNISSDCAHIYAAYSEARASTPAAPGIDVDALAQEIRRVDGGNSLGAGALAELLVDWMLRQVIDASPKGGSYPDALLQAFNEAKALSAERAPQYQVAYNWIEDRAREIAAMQATSAEVGE